MKRKKLTPRQYARNAALEDVLRDLIRAADRARTKRLPVGIVRAANTAIERCFDALERRLP